MKKISKIITFYEDGTFTEYTPSPYMPTPYVPVTNPWPSYPNYTVTCSGDSAIAVTPPTDKE